MNIRLNKKSIIMVPCIILVAAIIALGTTRAHAARPIIGKPMEPLVSALLQGGYDGISILNAKAQIILCARTRLPAKCVTVVNFSTDTPIQLFSTMDRGSTGDMIGMIEPGQTKAFCIPESPANTFLGLMQMNGGQGHGLALWEAYPTIPN